jgi:hypothetical protein
MDTVRIMDNFGVILRACEGLPLLILLVTFLTISFYLRNNTKF